MNAVPWSVVDPSFRVNLPVFGEILDGGQAFCWDRIAPNHYRGIVRGHAWEIGVDASGHVLAHSISGGDPALLSDYFALDIDFDHLADQLPWRSDTLLATAIEGWQGLRILRQDLGETLLGFLCSSSKQIVQIKEILRLLARAYGQPIADGLYSLPTWEALAGVPEAELRQYKMGYRARYIAGVAERLAAEPAFLETLRELPFAEARQALVSLPGVGEKIAECVLLFGGGFLEAFPIDTWIATALQSGYGLEKWSPSQLRQFAGIHFGPGAGLAQQYLFAHMRRRPRPRDDR